MAAADSTFPGEANLSMSTILPTTVWAAMTTVQIWVSRGNSQRQWFPLPCISRLRIPYCEAWPLTSFVTVLRGWGARCTSRRNMGVKASWGKPINEFLSFSLMDLWFYRRCLEIWASGSVFYSKAMAKATNTSYLLFLLPCFPFSFTLTAL